MSRSYSGKQEPRRLPRPGRPHSGIDDACRRDVAIA